MGSRTIPPLPDDGWLPPPGGVPVPPPSPEDGE